MNIVQIRYNTLSETPQTKWRAIVNGEEHICGNIEINVPAFTSSDELEGHGLKHHITCYPKSIIYLNGTIILTNDESNDNPSESYKDAAMETALNFAANMKVSPDKFHKFVRMVYEKKLLSTDFNLKDVQVIFKHVKNKK